MQDKLCLHWGKNIFQQVNAACLRNKFILLVNLFYLLLQEFTNSDKHEENIAIRCYFFPSLHTQEARACT